MAAFSLEMKKEFRVISNSMQQAYMHTCKILSVLQGKLAPILVSNLSFTTPKANPSSLHWSIFFSVSDFKSCQDVLCIIPKCTLELHACSEFVMCSLFPSLIGIVWEKNLLKEKCWSRRSMCLSMLTCMYSCCALAHSTEMTKYKRILSAIINACKFCWIPEKYKKRVL